jgi:predicted RNA-binding Zn ribbon-like protein
VHGSSPAADLELVRAFVNTLELEAGTETLGSAAGLATWIADHGLADSLLSPTSADLRRATDLREALRAHLLANNGQPLPADAVETLRRQAARSGVAVSFENGAASVLPTAGGVDGALGLVLAAAAKAMLEGSWSRLKACRAGNCRWAFIDHSRNQSRHWCAMDICGNRNKARAHRARQH